MSLEESIAQTAEEHGVALSAECLKDMVEAVPHIMNTAHTALADTIHKLKKIKNCGLHYSGSRIS